MRDVKRNSCSKMSGTIKFVDEERREVCWKPGIGRCLDVEHYMDNERLYHAAFMRNCASGHGDVATLPACFDLQAKGEWMYMNQEDFAKFTDFKTKDYQQHHTAEFKLAEIDNAPLRYCLEGCVKDCTKPVTDNNGIQHTSHVRQFFLRVGDEVHDIVVSMKPTAPGGTGVVDADGQFVIDSASFLRRCDSLVANKRWQLKRALLNELRLPHSAAGARPEVQERQESMKGAVFLSQGCSTQYPLMLNDKWPAFLRVTTKPQKERPDELQNDSKRPNIPGWTMVTALKPRPYSPRKGDEAKYKKKVANWAWLPANWNAATRKTSKYSQHRN